MKCSPTTAILATVLGCWIRNIAVSAQQQQQPLLQVEQTPSMIHWLRNNNNDNSNKHVLPPSSSSSSSWTVADTAAATAAEATPSACNAARDRSKCYQTVDEESGGPCQWCAAGAIPSECMSPSQAALLPAGVFDCTAPGGGSRRSSSATTTASAPLLLPLPAYQFASDVFGDDGRVYQLSAGAATATLAAPQPTASDLCDPASKSLSGYMDIRGSEYDSKDENKHLFFWMFERRPADAAVEQDEKDIPVRCAFLFFG
jgi:hypothetical protein